MLPIKLLWKRLHCTGIFPDTNMSNRADPLAGETSLISFWAVVENISRKVTYEGQPVKSDLAEYLITAVINTSPKYSNESDRFVSPYSREFLEQNLKFSCDDIPEIINECIDKIQNQPFETLTMDLQIFIAKDILPRETHLTNVQQECDAKTFLLLQDILSSPAVSQWDLDQLHTKVVTFIIRQSNLGSLEDRCIFQECAAALSSVWPDGTLKKFVQLNNEQKKTELQDYLLLSSGVRLFNREKDRGGAGIIDERKSFKDALGILAECLKTEEEEVEQDRDLITGLILAVIKGQFTHPAEELDTLKDVLIFLHQYLSTVLLLKVELKESKKIADRTQKNFQSFADKLEHTCRNERVVAADVVFPFFISLAKEWALLRMEVIRVQYLQHIFDCIQRYKQKWSDFKDAHVTLSKKDTHLEYSTEKISTSQIKNLFVRLVRKETTPKYEKIPHAYKGCCLVTLVEQDGFLINGNKNIGTLEFENKFYCFVDAQAAVRFSQNPLKYISEIDMLMKKKLILKNLLLSDFFNESEEIQKNVFQAKVIVKVDVDVQTVLHPIEFHIDHNYDWNIWNIRKKASNLHRITKCLTHSVQTNLSGFRAECGVQTTMAAKDQQVQTKKESSSKCVKDLQYLGGLRGGPDAYNKIRFKQIHLSSDKLENSVPMPVKLGNEL